MTFSKTDHRNLTNRLRTDCRRSAGRLQGPASGQAHIHCKTATCQNCNQSIEMQAVENCRASDTKLVTEQQDNLNARTGGKPPSLSRPLTFGRVGTSRPRNLGQEPGRWRGGTQRRQGSAAVRGQGTEFEFAAIIEYYMLTAELQELFLTNRKTEKGPEDAEAVRRVLNENEYANLIVNIMTYSQELLLSRVTIYRAKLYLESAIAHHFEPNLGLLSLACVRLAAKFSEPRVLSAQLTPEIVCLHGNGQFDKEELARTELRVVEALSHKLLFATPYDTMHAFFESFPWLTSLQQGLLQLLDFALTLPLLATLPASSLFYACFLALCRVKEVRLSTLQNNIVLSQIEDEPGVRLASAAIVSAYEQALSEAEQEGDQEQEGPLYRRGE